MTADHNETLKRQAKQVQRSVLIAELRSEQSRLSGLYVGKTCGVAANILAADMKEIEQLEATIVRLNNSLLDALTTLTELKQQKPVARVTCDGVMGVAFTAAANYGCDLQVGSLLYLAAGAQQVAVQQELLRKLRDSLAQSDKYPDNCCTWEQWIAKIDAALAAPQPPQGEQQ